jgi:hypothetical protein
LRGRTGVTERFVNRDERVPPAQAVAQAVGGTGIDLKNGLALGDKREQTEREKGCAYRFHKF